MARPKKVRAIPVKAAPKAVADKVASYGHPESTALLRPEIGAQTHFKKKKPPQKYRYDDSLSPTLEWDGQNSARELGEWLLARIEEASRLPSPHQHEQPKQFGEVKVFGLADAVQALRALGKPFLNWAGKAERLSFEVPTVPLFVHERLSTKAIIETLRGHKRDKQEDFMSGLFADPRQDLADQVTKAYEYPDKWVNRLILGDSLAVMNSLLHFENLGGQVQMIFMDPPYGVKFGSNFQPFVRNRNVSPGDDEDMTREPEMVQAYRDTWELGLHSYLTYMRDRLKLAHSMLHPSGSIFVQISDENLHHIREVMDDIFGASNFFTTIVFKKTGSEEGEGISNTADYLLWYARDKTRAKTFPLYRPKAPGEEGAKQYVYVRSEDFSEIRKLTPEELSDPRRIPPGWKVCRRGYPLTSQDFSDTRSGPFEFEGTPYYPGRNRHWSVSPDVGLPALVAKKRIYSTGKSLSGIMDLEDMPGSPIGNVWADTGTGSFTDDQIYVVQTSSKVLERCLLMTTEPGDLVLDPTCGSGTTAFMAEWWGRRWITSDVSRVPLALARQRLLTSTFSYYRLKDEHRGPAGGFDFKPQETSVNRKQDGYGVAKQHTLSSIAGDESPAEILFRENPERNYAVARVTGPFVVEATIPTAEALDEEPEIEGIQFDEHTSHVERMVEVLRRSPILRLPGNQTVTLKNIRVPAQTLTLSAEAAVEVPSLDDIAAEAGNEMKLHATGRPVAILFGPENGALTERFVREAWDEATLKKYTHLYVVGFAIDPKAREFIDKAGKIGTSATYLTATMDLQMGDLLKNMRSSQIFSVCGQPEAHVKELEGGKWQAELTGLDTFDPITMEPSHLDGNDVPAWFLDTNYNGMCFHVCQAFFPRTSAWENLKKALKGEFDESVWAHLSGTTSAPFEPGDQQQIAVKVIDDRGNELLVVKKLETTK
ncbi:MAG: site-specific DNA-methyltransferase [Chthoniobacter sp.]|nr:site-specific DNA-methyltransferase [Chthoniobacter sp.]